MDTADTATTAATIPTTMHAWQVTTPAPVAGPTPPLELVEKPVPTPGRGELLVHVHTCGVCRTDLHVTEGDLDVHHDRVTPGHEIVGRVVATGDGVPAQWQDARVGVAWLRSTCGECRWCATGRENLCPNPTYTGWDADAGYAEYTVVRAGLPASTPERPARLGLYGFGGSAHLCAQLALADGAQVHVLTRDKAAQELALSLGCASAAGVYDMPPEPLDAAVLFAPVGDIVPVAMRALDRGGVLSIAGIHLSDTPPLNYENELFYEKEIRSVTSNTRAQGRRIGSGVQRRA